MINVNEVIDRGSIYRPKVVKAKFNFKGNNNDELCFKRGDLINLNKSPEGGWWEGTIDGTTGWFPSNYVDIVHQDGVNSQPQDTLETLDKAPLTKDATIQQYRELVFKEILDTEAAFVRQLQQTMQKYLLPLQQTRIISDKEIMPVVSYFLEIIKTHKKFSSTLEGLIKLASKDQKIGGIFMEFAPTIREAHHNYCSFHPKFVHVMEQLKDPVCSFIQEICHGGPNAGEHGNGSVLLASSLSYSFRRLDKYPALLQELHRYTDEFHSDKGDTQRAGFVYKELVSHCAEIRRQKEMELEVMLGNIKNWPSNEQLIQSLGEIILMGPVMLTSSPDSLNEIKKDRYLVLFKSDILLLFISNDMTSFTFEKRLNLCDATLPRQPDGLQEKLSFDLLITNPNDITGNGKFIFECKTASEVTNWISNMQSCKNSLISNPTPVLNQNPAQRSFRSKQSPRNNVKSETSSESTSSSSAAVPLLPNHLPIRSRYWASKSLLPHPPMGSPTTTHSNEHDSGFFTSGSPKSIPSDDLAILQVIEAYYLSGKKRKEAPSAIFESPQVLLAEEEKIIIDVKTEIEEKSLVDAVYSLQEQLKELRLELSTMNESLKYEKKARRKLKHLLQEKLCVNKEN